MRPSSLFEGVAQRLCIYLNAGCPPLDTHLFTAGYQRWSSSARNALLSVTHYRQAESVEPGTVIAKFASANESSVLKKITGLPLEGFVETNAKPVYIHRIVRYFVKALDFIPLFRASNGTMGKSEDYKLFTFVKQEQVAITAALNSTLFYWFWRSHCDGFHCGYRDVYSFPWDVGKSNIIRERLGELLHKLMVTLRKTSERRTIKTKAGGIEYQEFYPKDCKTIIDEIDVALAEHHGFTEEELDFIINYDVKYRMGLSGGSGEDDGD